MVKWLQGDYHLISECKKTGIRMILVFWHPILGFPAVLLYFKSIEPLRSLLKDVKNNKMDTSKVMAYQSFRENGWVLISIVKEIFRWLLFSFEYVDKKLSVLGNYYLPVAPFLHSKLEGHQFALTMQCKIISVSTYNIQQLHILICGAFIVYKILPQRILLSCYVDGKHLEVKAYMLYKKD